ncbi:Protein tyrosine kinase [Phytophthora infestans]|uniref:Protein tyrosine kinase n=1 Tax=Phytophthora infestans TaxID=4787 RepID=A0A8S9TRW3_PHYIN|nr:Protein tyrosine kinase [Phytophthora infestans]
MPPGSASNTKRHTSRSAQSKHASICAVVSDTRCGSALLQKGGKCFSIKGNNSVHPVVPIARSLVLTPSTENTENTSTPYISTSQSPQNYLVKVRVLHGIDLHIPRTKTCQHPVRPQVNVTVNGSTTQSSTATQHARNHSTWKKDELKFRVSGRYQEPVEFKPDSGPSSYISMYVALACTACPCTSKTRDNAVNRVEIGEVGELQLPTKQNGDYEIAQFFPVIRRQQQHSHSSYALLPAGKIKLCIRVELEKNILDRVVTQPEIPKRPPFALPTNFGGVLQLKRKQLKATVAPDDNSQKSNNQQFDSSVSVQLLKEIANETKHDLINAENLKVEGQLGEGIHSCVSLGILHLESDTRGRQVAVKEFRHQHAVPPINVLRAFQQEYRILERCRNQNGQEYIVELLGVILEPRLVILMEYFSHSRHDMIHRDIKTHNILIGADLATPNARVKVGDLGSAVVWQQHEPLLLEEVGSSGYTAPEIFTHQGYGSKVDVWSFGVVLWEVASSSLHNRVNPFTGITGEEFVSKVQSGCRPHFAHTHQLCVKPVVEKCWTLNPSLRPTMDEVVNELEKLCSQL